MATVTSHAEVLTDKPVPYMRQLCKHFGHKNEAFFDADSGYIVLDAGRCDLKADDGRLHLSLTALDADGDERLRHVIGIHLERFGRADGLSVDWH